MELKTERKKWLLDTDIGCDSDDCMALGYLLARSDIDIMGITTVSGESYRRALFADVICKRSGKEIPVCRGNETDLGGNCIQGQMVKTQSEQVDRYLHNDLSEKNTAVLFMKRIIEENPGEIVLACIGQLTNAALLFAVYPHIPSLLKGMIIMGGRFREDANFDVLRWGAVEWNIKCDPLAAKIVFDANVKDMYVVGIEETCKFCKKAPEVSKKIAHLEWMEPVSYAIKEYTETWFHDAVAVWAMLNKNEAVWQKGDIFVNLESTDMGKTKFTPNSAGRHNVLLSIDVDKFFESYAKDMGFKWD